MTSNTTTSTATRYTEAAIEAVPDDAASDVEGLRFPIRD